VDTGKKDPYPSILHSVTRNNCANINSFQGEEQIKQLIDAAIERAGVSRALHRRKRPMSRSFNFHNPWAYVHIIR
jgi:hypothetical protein